MISGEGYYLIGVAVSPYCSCYSLIIPSYSILAVESTLIAATAASSSFSSFCSCFSSSA